MISIRYKAVDKSLYDFEKDGYKVHVVKSPAEVVFLGEEVWEVGKVHDHKCFICDTDLLISIYEVKEL